MAAPWVESACALWTDSYNDDEGDEDDNSNKFIYKVHTQFCRGNESSVVKWLNKSQKKK